MCIIRGTRDSDHEKCHTSLCEWGKPSGVIEVPGKISEEDAHTLKKLWETNYGGKNAGKTAILTENAKYKTLSFNPVDSQLVEQLKLTAEIVCSVFHVPLYKVGLGEVPHTIMLKH